MRSLRMVFFLRLMICIVCLSASGVLTYAVAQVPPVASAPASSAASGPVDVQSFSPSADNLTTINNTTCKSLPEAAGGVLMGRIIPCISYTIRTTAAQFSAESIAFFQPLFYAFLVLVVMLFGVKVVQGEQQVHQQGIMLLLKISLVILVLQLIPGVLVPQSFRIIDESVQVVSGSLGNNGSGVKCDLDKFGDANTPLVWKQMDCVLGKLYGFTTGNNQFASGTKTPNMVLASSMLGLLAGFAFGGTLALTVFMMCIGVLITIFMVVMRVALSFVNAYLILSLMFIIAPIFLPLAIMQSTTEFFGKWWKIILGALLLPMIMTAYAVIALLIYDRALFADDALIHKIFEADVMKKALAQPRNPCSRATQSTGTRDSSFSVALGANAQDMQANNPMLNRGIQGTAVSAEDPCSMIYLPTVEFSQIKDSAFKDPLEIKKALTDMFNDVLKLFLLAFLVQRGADAITSAVRMLVSSSTVSGSLTAQSDKETKFQQGIAGAKQAFNQSMGAKNDGSFTSGATGADFISKVPGALSSAGQAFIKRE